MIGGFWGLHVNGWVSTSSTTPLPGLCTSGQILLYVTSLSVSKNCPDVQRPGRGVVELVLTHPLTWGPQNPPIINFYLEKNGPLWKKAWVYCRQNMYQRTTVHFLLNKSWWSVGSERTTLTSGSIRVQRHHSHVSVRRGKFCLLTVMSWRIKFAPTYRDLGGVSLDSYWPTR